MGSEPRLGWRSLAEAMIRSLGDVAQYVHREKQLIDEDFPQWKEMRLESSDEYWSHDARREFFATAQTVLENAQLSYIDMRDYLVYPQWWKEKLAVPASASKLESVLKEHALMVKWYCFHALAMATEETFRAIQRSAPDVFPVERSIFYHIYGEVLRTLEMEDFGAFFDILRLTRNTIHTNGIFSPLNGKPRTMTYDGERFEFEVGKPLAWFDDDRLVWFARALTEIMFEIIRAPKVVEIEECPRVRIWAE